MLKSGPAEHQATYRISILLVFIVYSSVKLLDKAAAPRHKIDAVGNITLDDMIQ